MDNYRVDPETFADIVDEENIDLGTGLPVWEDIADQQWVNNPNMQNSALGKLLKELAPGDDERKKVTPFKGRTRTNKEFPRGPIDPKFYERTKGKRSKQNINAAVQRAIHARDTGMLRQYLKDKPDEEARRNFKDELGEAVADELGEDFSPDDLMDVLGEMSEEDFKGLIDDVLGGPIPPDLTSELMEPPLGMSQEDLNQHTVDNITRMGGSRVEDPHVLLDPEGEYTDYPAPMTVRMGGVYDKAVGNKYYKGRPGEIDPVSGIERIHPNIQNSALYKLMKAVEDDDEDGTRGAYRGKGEKHSGRGKDWKRRDRINRPDPEDTSGTHMSVNELAASDERGHKFKAYRILSRNAHKFNPGTKQQKLFERINELYAKYGTEELYDELIKINDYFAASGRKQGREPHKDKIMFRGELSRPLILSAMKDIIDRKQGDYQKKGFKFESWNEREYDDLMTLLDEQPDLLTEVMGIYTSFILRIL